MYALDVVTFSGNIGDSMKRLCVAFFRYLLAGGFGFVLDYAVLALCYEVFHIHYLLSSGAGFMVGLVFVYLVSNKWVFSTRRMKDKAWLEFVVFSVIGVIGLLLTILFMWFFVDVCKIYPLISKLVTTTLVLFWNFAGRKIILYS